MFYLKNIGDIDIDILYCSSFSLFTSDTRQRRQYNLRRCGILSLSNYS